MITNDLTHFPLVITVFDSALTIEQQKVFLLNGRVGLRRNKNLSP